VNAVGKKKLHTIKQKKMLMKVARYTWNFTRPCTWYKEQCYWNMIWRSLHCHVIKFSQETNLEDWKGKSFINKRCAKGFEDLALSDGTDKKLNWSIRNFMRSQCWLTRDGQLRGYVWCCGKFAAGISCRSAKTIDTVLFHMNTA
jgi:hypothetical protein